MAVPLLRPILVIVFPLFWVTRPAGAADSTKPFPSVNFTIGIEEVEANQKSLETCTRDKLPECRKWVRKLDEVRQSLPRSFTLHQSTCELGDAYSCWAVAEFLRQGLILRRDVSQETLPAGIEESLRAACRGVVPDKYACWAMGNMIRNRLSQVISAKEAHDSFQKACAGGYVKGCLYAAEMLSLGSGVARNRSKAISTYRSYCTEIETRGCFLLGFSLLGGGGDAPEQPGKAADREIFQAFRQSCEGGDPHGCSSLGWMVENARGAEPSMQMALAYYETGCSAGHQDGCRNAARIYRLHKPLQNLVLAKKRFLRSCMKLGDGESCRRLALFLEEEGSDLAVAGENSLGYFDRACRMGNEDACHRLRAAFIKGEASEDLSRQCKGPTCSENNSMYSNGIVGTCLVEVD